MHLERRGHHPGDLDLAWLAGACAQFSGAEIEAAVVAVLYTAFGAGTPVTTKLLRELQGTRPLALTRAEDLTRLRTWAHERALLAG